VIISVWKTWKSNGLIHMDYVYNVFINCLKLEHFMEWTFKGGMEISEVY